MKKVIKLFENKFVKNIILVTSGTAFAQILTIALSPIITRIYSPDEYGILSVYAALLALLSIIVSFEYQKAVPIAKDEESAYNIIAGTFVLVIITSFFLLLVFLIWNERISELLGTQDISKYLFLVPIGVLFVGIYNVFVHWSLRTKDFKTLTGTKITQSIASNFSKLLLGILGFGPLGLILGHIIGQSGGIFRLSKPVRYKKDSFIKAVEWKLIKFQLIRYIKFPLYSAPSNYVYTAGTQAPVLFLTAIFGTSVAGFYGLASSIVTLPITLLAMSVSQVFYSEAASIGKSNPNKIKVLSLKLSSKLALLGLIPLLVFVLAGPWLFSFVFGANWYEAGIYSRYLAILAYVHFLILPAGRILEVIEKQKIGLAMNIIRLILIILAFMMSSILGLTVLQTIIAYIAVSSLSYILLFIIVQRVLTREARLTS